MKKYATLLFSAMILTVVSCSPFQVHSDYAQSTNFNEYQTYQLRIDDLQLNDIDKDRVLNEISKQLKSKGLTTSQTPELIVNVKARHKNVNNIHSSRPYGMYGWGGPWGWGFGMQRTWNTNYNRGGLVIDIIDAKTQRLVWQGIGDGISVDSPKAKQKQIPQIVEEIMAEYPPR